jgi:hypothetical protein
MLAMDTKIATRVNEWLFLVNMAGVSAGQNGGGGGNRTRVR